MSTQTINEVHSFSKLIKAIAKSYPPFSFSLPIDFSVTVKGFPESAEHYFGTWHKNLLLEQRKVTL